MGYLCYVQKPLSMRANFFFIALVPTQTKILVSSLNNTLQPCFLTDAFILMCISSVERKHINNTATAATAMLVIFGLVAQGVCYIGRGSSY